MKTVEENFKMYVISYTHGSNLQKDTFNLSASSKESALRQFKDYINRKFLDYSKTANYMTTIVITEK